MNNLAAKVILEKSWVHNFIKSKHLVKKTLFSGEQIKVNKYRTKSGQMLHIALCIVVKYINENK